MEPLTAGSAAPVIEGIDPPSVPGVLFFYKVTCPVCQMAAPMVQSFQRGYSGRIAGIGQDPPPVLEDFGRTFGWTFPWISDAPPYPVSDAFGVRVVPTAFLLDGDRTVLDAVEAWDREGLNRISLRLAEMIEAPYVPISEEGDGLPPFRPG